MLIDCDTCTVRGEGCADCVVTVLLGAPPGWQDGGPTVVPLTRRPAAGGRAGGDDGLPGRAGAAQSGVAATGPGSRAGEPRGTHRADTPDSPGRTRSGCEVHHVDNGAAISRPVVELDDVERRAVRALADFGLVPPLRHQDASLGPGARPAGGDRHVS